MVPETIPAGGLTHTVAGTVVLFGMTVAKGMDQSFDGVATASHEVTSPAVLARRPAYGLGGGLQVDTLGRAAAVGR